MKCDDCGEEKVDVVHTICPFAYEIKGKEEEMALCHDCYQVRKEDI